MKHLVISEDELNEIFRHINPMAHDRYVEAKRIKEKVMHRSLPEDAIGFLHPPRTDDKKYTHSFFPKSWKVSDKEG